MSEYSFKCLNVLKVFLNVLKAFFKCVEGILKYVKIAFNCANAFSNSMFPFVL